jgi:hypothetical protein
VKSRTLQEVLKSFSGLHLEVLLFRHNVTVTILLFYKVLDFFLLTQKSLKPVKIETLKKALLKPSGAI